MKIRAILAVSLLLSSTPVFAAGNSNSLGDCLSDGYYGNEPNMADGSPGGPSEQTPGSQAGNVVPSQSPGPFVNNPGDPENPTRGRSLGESMRDFDYTISDVRELGFCPF